MRDLTVTGEHVLRRAHRLLDRARIPESTHGDRSYKALAQRFRILVLYTESLRGKYLRMKKKATAANQELAAYHKGNKKTWHRQWEELQASLDRCAKIFRERHLAPTFATSTGNAWIFDMFTFLIDRSNQLHNNDSARARVDAAAVEKARKAMFAAEARVNDQAKIIQWYETRFGKLYEIRTDEHYDAREMVDHMREADTFPWKRGNPGYLGDYTVDELLHEVAMRYKGISMSHQSLNQAYIDLSEAADGKKV